MKKVAISACLLGTKCRYDGRENRDTRLLDLLEGHELVAFCPEDFCYGTPRPTMDLIETNNGKKAISNLTGADMSPPITAYAKAFFDTNPDIELLVGKDRSPSCGVTSAKLYDRDKNMLSDKATGLMVEVALACGIECWDAEVFTHTS
ncbi:MAG TPA: DUF523 domain-containing protein [Sulfurovum sp.]|nr:DUF523 domain-containing protein [Sulfurovum sp.]